MNPHLFGFRNVYPLFVAVSVVVAVGTLVPAARRAGLSVGRLLAIESVLAAAGVLGAALYNAVEAGAVNDFGWRSLVGGGLRYPGGLIAIILVLPLVRVLLPHQMSLAGFLDLLAPSAAFAMACMRIGCFMVGCCYGHPSSRAWALSYPPLSQVARHHVANGWIAPGAWSLPVHPLQIYLGLASLAVGAFLVWLQRRKSYDGQVFLLYVALHEGAKAVLELLRGSLVTQSVVHLRLVSFGMAALATAALMVCSRRPRTRPETLPS